MRRRAAGLYLLHYLRVGDQRKQRGPANDVADQNRDEKVCEHRQDTEMSVQDKKNSSTLPVTICVNPAAAIKYVIMTMT